MITILFLGCTTNKKQGLFQYVDASQSKITFSNTITESDSINILSCLNCYNGAGVGIGDFNNDGLSDIVFCGNQVSSALYLNKGSLQFENISMLANFSTTSWITGVSIVDINTDGYDDIYLNVGVLNCKSKCKNLLFINNGLDKSGIPTFTERAEAFGLADPNYSQQAVFFDYDMDGDLDVYIVHNSNTTFNAFPISKGNISKNLADYLLRNDTFDGVDHPVFTNVSKELNITGKGNGLGIGIADFNDDNLIDVYVSNDFIGDDLLYLNKAHKDSLQPYFEEVSKQYIGHGTYNGMGMDIADINNDNLPDILVLDMLPKDYEKRKRMMLSMNYENYLRSLKNGYTAQYRRNTLQLGNGILDGEPLRSSEVGFLNGISSTDWSWGPLMVDFDNDGDKDIYITNGFFDNVIDLDFINFSNQKYTFGTKESKNKRLREYLQELPSIELPNFFYEQKEMNLFKDVSSVWIEEQPSLSNGVAYADLDLDGDLDMIVNNINREAFLLENKTSDKLDNHYLRVRLKGSAKNAKGIGAKVILWSEGSSQFQFQSVIRGYLSSMEPILHFGVKKAIIDSIKIIWPNSKISKMKDVKSDQVIEINEALANSIPNKKLEIKKTFNSTTEILNYKHKENRYNDYGGQHLLMRQYSQSGPCIAAANIDGKSGDEIFIGGSSGTPGKLWFQDSTGVYNPKQDFDSIYEDTDAIFFDFDNDADLDLYVSSGGNEFKENSINYADRLYLNNGQGVYTKAENSLPDSFQSTSCVRPLDIDHDNDIDLFVGSGISPRQYPKIPESMVLINDNGRFTKLPQLEISKVGMVKDAVWIDIDNDDWEDLIIVGEFMAISIFKNQDGELEKMPAIWLDENNHQITTEGWWNCIKAADFDKDGDIDLIAGNQGLNGYLQPEQNFPIYVYTEDLDQNGRLDPVLGQYFEVEDKPKLFPVHTRDEIMRQFHKPKSSYMTHEQFSNVDFKTLLKIKDLDSETLKATTFSSSYIENLGNGKFRVIALPKSCQTAPVNDILIGDFNQDDQLDVLLVGNDFSAESSYGRFDALTGLFLKGNKTGFEVIPSRESGFYTPYQSHHIIEVLDNKERRLVLSTQNNEKLRVFNVVTKK